MISPQSGSLMLGEEPREQGALMQLVFLLLAGLEVSFQFFYPFGWRGWFKAGVCCGVGHFFPLILLVELCSEERLASRKLEYRFINKANLISTIILYPNCFSSLQLNLHLAYFLYFGASIFYALLVTVLHIVHA